MISRKELLDMIATDAAEVISMTDYERPKNSSEELPPINYNLRSVSYEDGRMEWRD